MRPEDFLAAVEHRPRHRLGFIERLSHAGPLAALAGIGERHPGRGVLPVVIVPVNEFPEPLAQRVGVPERNTRTVIEMAPPDAGRPCHVRQQVPRGVLFRPECLRLPVEP